jgi:prepilin-type N-terminal cleavage/methylation domain-containing protein
MPLSHHRPSPCSVRRRGGFTLLEVLMALTITLILMALVMEMFTQVNDGIVNARAGMDLRDQLRNAKQRLITDLQGVTAPTIPPLDPSMQLGYFEYVEGPRVANSQFAANSVGGDRGENLGGNWYVTRGGNNNNAVNSMIGDNDDILMFTTSSTSDKFVGRGGVKSGVNLSVKSRTAEVAWFLRRRTEGEVRSRRVDNRPEYYSLHRRQFLVLPNGGYWGALTYSNVDHSLRPEGGNFDNRALPMNLKIGRNALDPVTRRNSLGDLTMRENRSLHQPYLWPYQMMYIAPQFIYKSENQGYHSSFNPALLDANQATYAYGFNVPTSMLSLPTLAEQTHSTFPLPQPEKVSGTGNYVVKTAFTPTPPPGYIGGTRFQQAGTRQGSDIILTNVIGFDVKAWDPGAPIFRAPASTANPNNAGVLVPGDAGYVRAIDLFNSSPTTLERQPVGFGAFADLNYMATEAAVPANTTRYRNYQDTGTTSLSALQRMENGAPFNRRCYMPRCQFGYPGDGPLSGNPTHGFARPAIWDTWSTHYEYDGIDNNGNGLIDEFTNGVDDNNNGLIDEPNVYAVGGVMTGEQEAPPPYRSPLRGIKITLRVMEQDSKEVFEVTIVHEFVPL